MGLIKYRGWCHVRQWTTELIETYLREGLAHEGWAAAYGRKGLTSGVNRSHNSCLGP